MAEADVRGARLEQVIGRNSHEIMVLLFVVCHRRDDTDAHAQPHIGLDHVGIHCRQYHVRTQPVCGKGLVEFRAAGEAEGVGYDRVRSDIGQRNLCLAITELLCQWMRRRCQNAAIPVVAGQHDELFEMLQRFGCDRKIGCTFRRHPRDLRRRTLMQMQAHLRIGTAEFLDDRRQRVARLRMRRGEAQLALVGGAEFLGDVANVLGFEQQFARVLEDALAGRRDFGDMLAVAHEDVDAKFFLQQAHLLRHAGLRSEHRIGGSRDVQTALRNFLDVMQLAQFHESLIFDPLL